MTTTLNASDVTIGLETLSSLVKSFFVGILTIVRLVNADE